MLNTPPRAQELEQLAEQAREGILAQQAAFRGAASSPAGIVSVGCDATLPPLSGRSRSRPVHVTTAFVWHPGMVPDAPVTLMRVTLALQSRVSRQDAAGLGSLANTPIPSLPWAVTAPGQQPESSTGRIAVTLTPWEVGGPSSTSEDDEVERRTASGLNPAPPPESSSAAAPPQATGSSSGGSTDPRQRQSSSGTGSSGDSPQEESGSGGSGPDSEQSSAKPKAGSASGAAPAPAAGSSSSGGSREESSETPEPGLTSTSNAGSSGDSHGSKGSGQGDDSGQSWSELVQTAAKRPRTEQASAAAAAAGVPQTHLTQVALVQPPWQSPQLGISVAEAQVKLTEEGEDGPSNALADRDGTGLSSSSHISADGTGSAAGDSGSVAGSAGGV